LRKVTPGEFQRYEARIGLHVYMSREVKRGKAVPLYATKAYGGTSMLVLDSFTPRPIYPRTRTEEKAGWPASPSRLLEKIKIPRCTNPRVAKPVAHSVYRLHLFKIYDLKPSSIRIHVSVIYRNSSTWLKVKFTLEHAMKAKTGRTAVALLFL
jgi:hypothetical protein